MTRASRRTGCPTSSTCCRSRRSRSCPAGAGVGVMKEQYASSLQLSAGRVRAGAADCLRERREPAARALGRATDADGGTAGDRRVAIADRPAGARRKRPARHWRRHGRPCHRDGRRATAALPRVLRLDVSSHQHTPVAAGAGVRVRRRGDYRRALRRRPRVPRDAHRSDRCAARIGPIATGDHSSFTRTSLLVLQATLSVVLVAGATMLGRSLNNVQHQNFGYTCRDRVLVAMNRPPANYTLPQLTAMYRTLEDRLDRIPGRPVGEPRALQPAHRQLGRTHSRRRPSAAKAERKGRRVVGSRQRALPAEPRHDDGAWPHVHGSRQ